MNDFQLDDVRLKNLDDVSEDEAKFLGEKWDDLTEEEQTVFDSVVQEDWRGSQEEPEYLKLTQDEFDNRINQAVESAVSKVKETKPKEEPAPPEEEEEGFFPEGYKAEGWNEAFQKVYPKLQKKIIKDITEAAQKKKRRLDKINAKFDQEIEELRKKDSNIPKQGTEDRREFDTRLAKIGVEYKLSSMTDAYRVYKALEKSKGGEDQKRKKVSKQQKSLRDKVGGGSGAGGDDKEEIDYDRITNKSLDELIEEEMAKRGIK